MSRAYSEADYPYIGQCEQCDRWPVALAKVICSQPGTGSPVERLWCPDCVDADRQRVDGKPEAKIIVHGIEFEGGQR